jgi:hypothetical protein
MAQESTRSKMIREAGEGKDLSPVKKAVQSAAYGVSRIADRVGFTQEGRYAGKPKEDLQKKGYKRGGKVMAKKPTKGYACGGKVMKKASGRGR